MHAMKQMICKNIMVSKEKSKTKDTSCMIVYMKFPKKANFRKKYQCLPKE